ncbi:MAG: MBL fold metallo-hydrolase [Chloroflexi bacterium]|nr:MBL fold metallo-hydrolase [Chloroflexota bacterium]
MPLEYEGEFRLYRVPMGPYDNNGYIVADGTGLDCYLVDAPAEPEKLLKEAEDLRVKGILITHNHGDHVAGLEVIRRTTRAPVGVHQADADRVPGGADFFLKDGDDLKVGRTSIRVIHTPGHTPGSVCLLVGKHLISGDTLFPGGPGKTRTPEDLRQIVRAITEKLLALDPDVVVYPGHGEGTTVWEAREEYRVFASRPHPPDLCGDVLWLKS